MCHNDDNDFIFILLYPEVRRSVPTTDDYVLVLLRVLFDNNWKQAEATMNDKNLSPVVLMDPLSLIESSHNRLPSINIKEMLHTILQRIHKNSPGRQVHFIWEATISQISEQRERHVKHGHWKILPCFNFLQECLAELLTYAP